MLCTIPVALEVNLNGYLSRLKASYRIHGRNASFSNSLSHYLFYLFFFNSFTASEYTFKKKCLHNVLCYNFKYF